MDNQKPTAIVTMSKTGGTVYITCNACGETIIKNLPDARAAYNHAGEIAEHAKVCKGLVHPVENE